MDSQLNIIVRVQGRQAQQQLQAVSAQLKQVKRMVGKTPTVATGPASSPWSPAIAKRMATQAANAAKQATNAQQRVLSLAWKKQTTLARQAAANQARTTKQAATQSHRQMVTAQKQQQQVLSRAWTQQQQTYRNHLARMAAAQKANGKTMTAQQTAQQKKMAKMGGLSPLGFAENLQSSKLVNAGKNINWVGRQLTYNFTLPIVAAGTAAFKFSMDIERQMTNLRKVYGDVGDDQATLKAETDALGKSFELLSTRFGIHQEDVIEIGAAWAAAGAAGSGLAQATRATIETMILGDMDAQAATEGLIAIQSQWRFSTKENEDGVSELTQQLSYLNAIENATGISTSGLVEVIQRAGGTARTSGASLRELGALAAALVPATGDAAQAGTALRSIISSLQSPTQQAMDALKLMGITVTDPAWMGADVVEKLKILSHNFVGLSDAQQGVVSQFIATKWQVSRFDVLMRDIASGTGYFQKALDVTADSTEALKIRQRELETVLESNPKKWDIMMNATRNALTKAIMPMIPAIMSLVKFITELAVGFSKLNPQVQKWILIALFAIAALGPLMSVVGSTMQLLGTFQSGLVSVFKGIKGFITKALFPLIKALFMVSAAFVETAATGFVAFLEFLGPIGVAIVLAIAAIVGAVMLVLHTDLEDRIWDVIKSIASAFWALPKEIGEALLAVLKMIGRFMEAIVDALSYLNPFARHSPSLVDNVRRGVSTILDEYSRLRAIPSMVFSAANALDAFSQATNAEGQNFREADLRKKANTAGASPGGQQAANVLVSNILQLERSLGPLETAINTQETIVDRWASALKAADDEIDLMEKNLKGLETEYDKLGDQIQAANQKISDLAATPIEGMGALEDQIFANSLAQDKLNMELLEFEKRGLTLDSITDKYAAMAGEIETLQGTQAELRGAGAGSDILGWYDDQIQAIRSQRSEMGDVEQTIQDIQNKLDALDLEQRFLDLTKAINFDPLERQIDQIANKVTEMPFDEIVRQIQEQQAIIEQLTPDYEALGAQVAAEKDNIEAANAARDITATKLDMEQEKLDQLKDAYSDIKNLISDMEGALNDYGSAAKAAADEASRLEDLFAAGEGLDFEDQGGNAPLGREGGLDEINALNEELQRQIDEMMASMGNMDLLGTIQDQIDKLKDLDFLGPVKEAWQKVVDWLTPIGQWFKDHLWAVFSAAFWFAGGSIVFFYYGLFKVITTFVPIIAGWINDHVIQPIWQAIQVGWDLFLAYWGFLWENLYQPILEFGLSVLEFLWPPIKTALDFVVGAFQWAWGLIEPILGWIWDKIDGYIIPIFELFSVSAQIIFKLVVLALQWLWGHFDEIFGLIWGAITNVVVPVFEWLWQRAGDFFQLLGAGIVTVWRDVIEPIFNTFKSVIENVVVPAFSWLWSEAERMFRALGAILQVVWDTVFAPLWAGFMIAFNTVVKPAFEFLRDNIIKPIMDSIYNVIKNVWNTIAGVIEGGVNFFIKAFNLVAEAVNAVAGFLHIDARVSTMDPISMPRIGGNSSGAFGGAAGSGGETVQMAAGGVAPIDRRGGAYNMPRAIVGEGSRIHPEFVIPTDPKFRPQALAFWKMAGAQLMASGGIVPDSVSGSLMDASTAWKPDATWGQVAKNAGVGGGGGGGSSGSFGGTSWLEKAMGAVSAAGKAIVQGAIQLVWKPVKALAQAGVNLIPNGVFRQAGSGILDAVDAWVSGRSNDWDKMVPTPQAGGGPVGVGPTGSGATAAGIPITQGPGSWHAFVTLLDRMGIPFTNLGTYANRNTAATGKPSMHSYDRAMDFGGTQATLQAVDHALYDAFKPWLYELIWKGPDARNVYKGQDHIFSPGVLDPHAGHVHASMAAGGRFNVPHIPGGVNLNISEGRSGEQVQILPVDEASSGGTTIVIHGNLEFPNVKNGSDAKDFIDNLRALAN